MEEVSAVQIASTSSPKLQDKNSLEIALNGLWVEYLNLLNRYQYLRQELSKSFSTVGMKIIHQQWNCANLR